MGGFQRYLQAALHERLPFGVSSIAVAVAHQPLPFHAVEHLHARSPARCQADPPRAQRRSFGPWHGIDGVPQAPQASTRRRNRDVGDSTCGLLLRLDRPPASSFERWSSRSAVTPAWWPARSRSARGRHQRVSMLDRAGSRQSCDHGNRGLLHSSMIAKHSVSSARLRCSKHRRFPWHHVFIATADVQGADFEQYRKPGDIFRNARRSHGYWMR